MNNLQKKQPVELVQEYLDSQEAFESNNKTYIKFTSAVTDDFTVMPLDDSRLADHVLSKVHENYNVIPTDRDIASALRITAARSRQSGDEKPVYSRYAYQDNYYYLDLANGKKQIVKLNEWGWSVENNKSIMFYKSQNMREIPEPNSNCADPYEFFNFVNVRDSQQQLQLLAFMTSLLRPDIQRPILTITGSAGSAKTTCARMIRLLIDPASPLEVDVPYKDDEFSLAFFANQVPLFDNVGHFNQNMSNGFCKAVTGAAFSKRKLYTDLGQVSVSYRRPIITTSLNIPSDKPDYHRRMLHIPLEPILRSKRRSETDLMDSFKSKRSQLLGSLLDLTCKALRELPSVKLDRCTSLPDFDRWGAAVAKALGKGTKAFIDSRLNTSFATEDLEEHESTPIVQAVIQLAQAQPNWIGTMQQLFDSLEQYKCDARSWPKNAISLGIQRNELNSILDPFGCQIVYIGKRNGKQVYQIACEQNVISVKSSSKIESASQQTDKTAVDEDSVSEIVAVARKLYGNASSDDESEEGYKSVFS